MTNCLQKKAFVLAALSFSITFCGWTSLACQQVFGQGYFENRPVGYHGINDNGVSFGFNGDNFSIPLTWEMSSGEGQSTVLMMQHDVLPDGNGTYSSFQIGYSFNESNQLVAAFGVSGNESAVVTNGEQGARVVVRTNTASPDGNGTLLHFAPGVTINNQGDISFVASIANSTGGSMDNHGIFMSRADGLHAVVRENDAAPGGGNFSDLNPAFESFVTNDNSQVVFHSTLRNSTTSNGIFVAEIGQPVVSIFRSGDQLQSGEVVDLIYSGSSNLNYTPLINNQGNVAFVGTINGTTTAVFVGNGQETNVIARENETVNGDTLVSIDSLRPLINQNNQVMFSSTIRDSNGNDFDTIFRNENGSFTELVRQGQALPGGNGLIDEFLGVAFNDRGAVALHASVVSSGISGDEGIFLSDGIDFISVIKRSDSINNGVVGDVSFIGSQIGIGGLGYNPQSNLTFNNMGQVIFQARIFEPPSNLGPILANVFTPDLQFRFDADGNWDEGNNWTLGVNPAFVHNVAINNNVDVLVAGPTSATRVKSLQVGFGLGQAELVLNQAGSITSDEGVLIGTQGVLEGNGMIIGNIDSQGTLSPGGDGVVGEIQINGSLILGADSLLNIDLDSASEFDSIIVSDALTLDGALAISLVGGRLPNFTEFEIIDFQGPGSLIGEFDGLAEGALVGIFGNQSIFVSYQGGDGNNVVLLTIPEPSGLLALVALAAGFGLSRRHSNRRPKST